MASVVRFNTRIESIKQQHEQRLRDLDTRRARARATALDAQSRACYRACGDAVRAR
jgi:hypothetical protein